MTEKEIFDRLFAGFIFGFLFNQVIHFYIQFNKSCSCPDCHIRSSDD